MTLLVLHNPLNSFSCWQNSLVGFPQVAAQTAPVHIDNGLVRRSPARLRVDNTPPVTGGHRVASDHVDLGLWGDRLNRRLKMSKSSKNMQNESTCSFPMICDQSKQQLDDRNFEKNIYNIPCLGEISWNILRLPIPKNSKSSHPTRSTQKISKLRKSCPCDTRLAARPKVSKKPLRACRNAGENEMFFVH